MAKFVLITVFLMSFAVCKSQTTYGTYTLPLIIQVQDSTFKELGYFKFNPVTKTVTTRGTQKYVWDFFTNKILLPMQQRETALMKIKDALYVDGRVRCWECFLEGLRQWDSVRISQDIPDFIDK